MVYSLFLMFQLPWRLAYLRDSALQALLRADKRCPACGAAETHLVRRKHLVTQLRECSACYLRFRWPKDRVDDSYDFYQDRYSQGFTTDCPNEDTLKAMTSTNFKNTEKDYSTYIEVLRALDLKQGSVILDFGCSWGYGSWQFSQHGFEVYSYEISAPRARYASEKLTCKMLKSIADCPRLVDCFFSAHVIEHLPDPNIFWNAALQKLTPQGVIVCACPNGNPIRQTSNPAEYHSWWGKVHPLFLTPHYVSTFLKRNGLEHRLYSPPYDFEAIQSRRRVDEVSGAELLIVAWRPDTT